MPREKTNQNPTQPGLPMNQNYQHSSILLTVQNFQPHLGSNQLIILSLTQSEGDHAWY